MSYTKSDDIALTCFIEWVGKRGQYKLPLKRQTQLAIHQLSTLSSDTLVYLIITIKPLTHTLNSPFGFLFLLFLYLFLTFLLFLFPGADGFIIITVISFITATKIQNKYKIKAIQTNQNYTVIECI